MMFPPQFLDDLRSRLPASQVVSRKVKLRSKGGGEHTGLCCFHNEKTPSFTVSDDKGFYHCFGCGAHGDIVKFVMETEGQSFTEAVTRLAEEAGMQLPKVSREEQERYAKTTTLYDVMEKVAAWYEEQLKQGAGEGARAYIAKRKLTDETVATFRLGYAPDSRGALKAAMLARDVTEQQMLDCGLLIKPEDGGDSYDRFRGRLMFPIRDPRGRVIAFGGRILGDGEPKYLNSPETDLFHKGHVLYNFDIARTAAHKKKAVAVVEGYMDAIALHQVGISNVVAPLGTAMTEHQLRLLWNVANEPVMCLDGDKAGIRAMMRAAELALPLLQPGKSLKFCILPQGMDPDDLIKKEGVDAIRQLLGKARTLMEILWERAVLSLPHKTPEQMAALEQKANELAGNIKDASIQANYRDAMRNKLWELKREQRSKPQASAQTGQKPSAPKRVNVRTQYEAQLMLLLLRYPTLLGNDHVRDALHGLNLEHEAALQVYDALEMLIGEHDDASVIAQEIEADEQLAEVATKLEALIDLRSIAHPNEVTAEAAWQYIASCIEVDQVEREYQDAAKHVEEDDALARLEALKKHRDGIKMLAKRKKMAYEALLDD